MTIAWLADRRGSRRAWLMGFAIAQIIGLLGVMLIPGGGWGWAALIGATTGPLFPLTMTLPIDVGRTSADVAAFTGLMLGGGYTLSALSRSCSARSATRPAASTRVLWVLVGMSAALLVLVMPRSARARLAARRARAFRDRRRS